VYVKKIKNMSLYIVHNPLAAPYRFIVYHKAPKTFSNAKTFILKSPLLLLTFHSWQQKKQRILGAYGGARGAFTLRYACIRDPGN